MTLTSAYYFFKPVIPRKFQISLRREVIRHKLPQIKNIWPIDESAAKPPQDWQGWPNGKKFALVITHDVDTQLGHDKSAQLADIDESMGFRSSFNFVAEDYKVSPDLLKNLADRGFEIGSHGIHHSNPFLSREFFDEQATQINRYLKDWNAVGFRSPSMFRNAEFIHDLDISYDASTFDTDPFEPQPEGVGTIFPFYVSNNGSPKGYVELPYTLPQDFFCFILMKHDDIRLWKKKLDWIVEKGGMALFIAHPDYMNFDGITRSVTEYPADYYREFLTYIKEQYPDQYWHVLPKEMARFWARNYGERRDSALSGEKRPHGISSEPLCKIVEIDPLQDSRWDQFVKNHPFGLICHLSGWKQVLEDSFPHMKGYYLVLLNRDDSIKAALPVYEVKSILTGNRLVSIPFATNCDPLISSEDDMRMLLDAAIDLSEKLGCPKIEIKTLASSSLLSDNRICSVVKNKSHQLSLEIAPEEIIKTYSRKTRWTINQSLKKGFSLQLADSEKNIEEFYRLYVKTRKRLGLPPQPYQFFKLLWNNFAPPKYFALLLVKHEGKLVAGLLMYKFKNRCSWDYLASDKSYERLSVNYFGVWEAIKLAHSEGYKIFDFGRTGINNKGLMSFKGRWGTSVIDLPQLYYPKHLCKRMNSQEESSFYNLIRKISKNLPDPVFQIMGNFLYRHLW